MISAHANKMAPELCCAIILNVDFWQISYDLESWLHSPTKKCCSAGEFICVKVLKGCSKKLITSFDTNLLVEYNWSYRLLTVQINSSSTRRVRLPLHLLPRRGSEKSSQKMPNNNLEQREDFSSCPLGGFAISSSISIWVEMSTLYCTPRPWNKTRPTCTLRDSYSMLRLSILW